MDIIKWRALYETGVEEMDSQHHRIIDLINTLFRILRDKKEEKSLESVLSEMAEYASKHLRDEEQLLKERGYPDYEAHVEKHMEYLSKIEQFTEENQEGVYKSAQEMYAFLRRWWLKHIIEEDKKYGEFLKEQ